MANKKGLGVILGAAVLCAPALAYAQGGPAQAAGLNDPDAPAVQPVDQPMDQPADIQPAAPLPGDPDYVEPGQTAREQAVEQETIKIRAPRYPAPHYLGSPNRLNPMAQFPGELPERDHYQTPFDLQGIVVQDGSKSEVLPTSPGLPPTPDPLSP